MKKKLLVLLSSVVAGVGLVGATFAAWAITDNADPLGIKISPSAVSESTDGYSTMVLSWGDKTQFTNIAGLALDETKVVSLEVASKVTAIDSDHETGGNLVIRLNDYTESHVQGAPKLVDNLEVKAYKFVDNVKTYIDGLVLGGETKEANANIATPVDGSALRIYFEVSIANTVTAPQYSQMQNDVVYLFADWNKPTGITEVTTTTVFFKAAEAKLGAGTPHVYAYKETSTGINKNAEWPGVEMSIYNTENKVYSIALEAEKFDHVIFSYGASGLDQTADLELDATKPLYDAVAKEWKQNTYQKDVQEPVYYLVGNVNEWDTVNEYKLHDEGNGTYTFQIEVPEGGLEYKIKDKTNNTWYSYTSTDGNAQNCSWDTAGDTINITFNPAGQTYVTQVKAA